MDRGNKVWEKGGKQCRAATEETHGNKQEETSAGKTLRTGACQEIRGAVPETQRVENND